MSGSRSSMLSDGSILSRTFARPGVIALFFFAWMPQAFGQFIIQTGAQTTILSGAPPPDVTINKLPARDPNAIAVDGWLLYPTLRLYTLYSDNFFQSPQNPLSVGGLGVTPTLTAVWSNGIHTTTLYGGIDRQDYPTDNSINTLDGRAGFTQRYEALRDLIFTVNGDYTHRTLNTGLQNAIQVPVGAPATAVLANGNTVLPNGTILSPAGQVVGQTTTPTGSSVALQVNPSNQVTGAFTIDKLFSRAAISLSGSVSRSDFENQTVQPNFSSRTLNENVAAWLGPLVYAYSSGVVSTVVDDAVTSPGTSIPLIPSSSTTSYRVVGGLGTRLLELFRGSAYFGYQASDASTTGGSATAGGQVYGGVLYYTPTVDLTLAATFDKTFNIASQVSATNLALTLPGQIAVQVPIGASTVVTSYGLRSTYQITQQWFANCQLSYSRIEYVESPRIDNSWVLDTTLRYDIWRNMSILWEYRYSTVISNAPLTSFSQNYAIVGATYRF
jgi:Putative beta-barrel porin 2